MCSDCWRCFLLVSAKHRRPTKRPTIGAKKPRPSETLATFTLDESYPEGPGQPGIFGDLSPNLAKMIERIDKAAADDKVFGIMIHLEDAATGARQGRRTSLRDFAARKAGKKVYAELNETTQPRISTGLPPAMKL